MDEYHYLRRSHVPAFGSWEYCTNNGAASIDDLPFTQCFESARQPASAAAGGFYPIYTAYSQDQDLYVAGDLYQNDVVTPTMIVVSRNRGKRNCQQKKGRQGKDGKTMMKKKDDDDDDSWMQCDAVKVVQTPERKIPKAVDEDLYKISPDLLHTKPKMKRKTGLFSSCLRPICVS
ncbi:uncharacterized protein LOC124921284 [Impatiens glandulifera]|uniref:uncharacterized protein LOC124921284 n=1 Tax=Impatiens glandulifera TaxID=253017 RepID=UPI001FB19885|nr:uncharacterized protein LOC124921284 [Impatiens glandulifera]